MFLQTRDVALFFRNPFSDQTAQTFSSKKIYDVLILPRDYQADDLYAYSLIYFSAEVKFSAIRIYAHTCACPDKAAQMYFSSMNYATRMCITSNYHIVIKLSFFVCTDDLR